MFPEYQLIILSRLNMWLHKRIKLFWKKIRCNNFLLFKSHARPFQVKESIEINGTSCITGLLYRELHEEPEENRVNEYYFDCQHQLLIHIAMVLSSSKGFSDHMESL